MAGTPRERLRYKVDSLLSRGPLILIAGLVAFTIILVIGVSLLITAVGWANESGVTFIDVVWRAILTTLDTGSVGGLTGGTASPGYLLALLVVTVAGLIGSSFLIGILVTTLQARLDDLRQGRSRVIESGQTVVLGWSQQVFAIIAELVTANANRRRSCIVVLAPQDKVAMEDQIRARVPHPGRTKIVCRNGSPIDVTDLHLASIETAKAIIVLAPDVDDPDTDVIKTILAITNSPHRRVEPYHIVAEIRRTRSLAVARAVGRAEAQLIVISDLIARITAQTCRQSGLSIVYTQLLEFEGDSIYEVALPPDLIGADFGDVLLAYDDSTVIGYVSAAGAVKVNPPMNLTFQAGDRLLAISRNEASVRKSAHQPDLQRKLIAPVRAVVARPERTLILGWNRRGPAIIRELDAYVAPGSTVIVNADRADLDAAPGPEGAALANSILDVRTGDPTERETLAALCAEDIQHVIVLCSDLLDPQRADAKTLITLIHLRDIVQEGSHQFSITSEMLDLRNRALAEVTRADDFIVSDRLASLLLGQLSENRHLKDVFDDLFSRIGSEIFLRPAREYVQTREPMTFATIVESARRRGEVAIGYRQVAYEADPDRAHGVVVNPSKSSHVLLADDDRVIVLAEGPASPGQTTVT